jgi:hypothetical protein
MLTWFGNLKVGQKIGLGFGLMTLLLASITVYTISQVGKSRDLTVGVIEIRTPTAMNSLKTLNGMNRSIGALRGWMILGKDSFNPNSEVGSLECGYFLGVILSVSVGSGLSTHPSKILRRSAPQNDILALMFHRVFFSWKLFCHKKLQPDGIFSTSELGFNDFPRNQSAFPII